MFDGRKSSYSFESSSGNRAYGSGIGRVLSEVSVDVSGIGHGLIVERVNWSTIRTEVGR